MAVALAVAVGGLATGGAPVAALAATAQDAITVDDATNATGTGDQVSVALNDSNATVQPYYGSAAQNFGAESLSVDFTSTANPAPGGGPSATFSAYTHAGNLATGTYSVDSADGNPTHEPFVLKLYGFSTPQCEETIGTVVVLQADHDGAGILTGFAARYVLSCLSSTATTPITGDLRWHSDVDYVALSSSSRVDLGRNQIGQPVALTDTITNLGTVPAKLGAPVLGGADPGTFALTSDGCGSTDLHPGASCVMTVTATPPAVDQVTATLTLPDPTALGSRRADLLAAGMYAPSNFVAAGGPGGGRISYTFAALDAVAEESSIYDPVSSIQILRGTSPGALAVYAAAGGREDDTAVPGTVYYYAARLVTRAGHGATSAVSNGAVAWDAGGAGRYFSVPPARVLDTRSGLGAVRNRVGPGVTIHVRMTGRGGVPLTGVSAVVVNLTAVGGTASTYLTVFPTLQPRPLASSINVTAGQIRANLVTVPVGSGGEVDVYNSRGTINIVADVVGYYTDPNAPTPDPVVGPYGGEYFPLVPTRIIDTRLPGQRALPSHYAYYQTLDFGSAVSGHISALALSITVVAPQTSGFVTAWNSVSNPPGTSTVDFAAHATVPNLAIVPVADCASPCVGLPTFAIYNGSSGALHLVVDVVGYYDDNWLPGGLRFHPLTPTRVADTRTGLGAPQALGPQTTVTVTPPSALTDALTAAEQLNVTAVAASASTVITVWPAGLGKPLASNLNVPVGATLADAVVTGVGPAGAFDVYNDVGTVNIVADLVGTFEAWPSPPAVAGQAAPRTALVAALAGRIGVVVPPG